jgi:DNA-binding NtrC family response regulator
VTQLPLTTTEESMEDVIPRRLKLVDPGPVPVDKEPVATVFPLRYLREQAEIKAIQSALKLTGWNRKRASRLLKISYRGLLYKIRRHDIRPA